LTAVNAGLPRSAHKRPSTKEATMYAFVADHFLYLVFAEFAVFAAAVGFVSLSERLAR
jgi:membrane-anchored protein YejM (alkaline phosphatase superfamily)